MTQFTKKLAEAYLNLPAFNELEREISDSHVEALMSAMKGGRFLNKQAVMSIAYCEWDKLSRKLNGQHISWARWSLPDDIKYAAKIRVVKYKVRTEDEYRKLYACFDRNRTRTTAHLGKMGLFGTPEYEGIKKSIFPYIIAGAKFWYFGAEKTRIDDVITALRTKIKIEGRIAAEIITDARNNQLYHLQRGPVVGAMMETLNKSKEKAAEFWNKLIVGLFQSRTDPAKILSDYLHRTTLGSTKGDSRRTPVYGEDMYNVCVSCFNAFKSGMPLTKTPPGKRSARARAL